MVENMRKTMINNYGIDLEITAAWDQLQKDVGFLLFSCLVGIVCWPYVMKYLQHFLQDNLGLLYKERYGITFKVI